MYGVDIKREDWFKEEYDNASNKLKQKIDHRLYLKTLIVMDSGVGEYYATIPAEEKTERYDGDTKRLIRTKTEDKQAKAVRITVFKLI